MSTKLTAEEMYLASLPLWLVRAEIEMNGDVDSDFLIAVTQARVKKLQQSLQDAMGDE